MVALCFQFAKIVNFILTAFVNTRLFRKCSCMELNACKNREFFTEVRVGGKKQNFAHPVIAPLKPFYALLLLKTELWRFKA